jgi:hypothetical protein
VGYEKLIGIAECMRTQGGDSIMTVVMTVVRRWPREKFLIDVQVDH